MLDQAQLQQAVATIATLDRGEIARQLRRDEIRFPVDFTPEWIASRSLDELRHVYAAICLQCDLMPDAPARNAFTSPPLRLAA